MSKELQILRLKEVCKMVGLSRSAIYHKIKHGQFPTQLKLGPRSSGWHLHEIEAWIENRPRA